MKFLERTLNPAIFEYFDKDCCTYALQVFFRNNFDPKTCQNLCQKHSLSRRVEQKIEAGPSSVTIQAVSASTGVLLSAGVATREGLLIDPGLPFRVTPVSH